MITFLTLVIAVFTILIWRTYTRLNWLVAAQESHSSKMLQIEAKRSGEFKIVWWDPMQEPWPHTAKHGTEVNLETIYIGVPEPLRKPKSLSESVWYWWRGGRWVRPQD